MQYNIGILGESVAQNYLEKINLKIIANRYKTKFGEIDIIALDENKNTIIFCEIKSSKSKDIDFENLITRRQWRRLLQASEYFFTDPNFAKYHSCDQRFDSIFVTAGNITLHNEQIVMDDFATSDCNHW